MRISEIMSTLDRLGAAPRKSLGQNFLHDQNLARWIVRQLDSQPGDRVVEIGPGLGALSCILASSGLSATLLEKDALFAKYLRGQFCSDQIEVIAGDALDYDIRVLFPEQPVKLLGALPYYLSTPLIFHFTAQPCPFDRIVLTLQRELADRLVAKPGTKPYGSLTLIIQSRWIVERLRLLSSSVFIPQPQVDSAVVRITPRNHGSLPIFDRPTFQRFVKIGFSQRRKRLTNLLGQVVDPEKVIEALVTTGISTDIRAEALSLEQWIALVNKLCPTPENAAVSQESLDIVNEHDEVVGQAPRGVIHREKCLHRAVHILVFNEKNELLLQHRSVHKDQYPGCWDSSASGHVESGETYQRCAIRELKEELDLSGEPKLIRQIPASAATGFEFISLYQIRSNEPVHYHPGEIEEVGFFPLPLVDTWLGKRPQDFAPGFREAYRAFRAIGEEPQITQISQILT
jgi:16S rRNA (adenine1518-N6/adenine1519-N6)-dimethyltransferase